MKATFNKKPIESISALMLVLVGVGISVLTNLIWSQAVGAAMAAVGGALFSRIAVADGRDHAIVHLKPELLASARHLADSVTKMNRTIQGYQSGSLPSETAIDRVAQLSSTLYGTVNDLHILVGSPPDFQMLIETVDSCEQMAERLERLTDPNQYGDDDMADEFLRLRQELESARMQLTSAKREFSGVEIDKTDEKVNCPACGRHVTVRLGKTIGDSAVHTCSECMQRFHIHRDNEGKAFTRPWGGMSRHIVVECPNCHNSVPLNFNPSKQFEERYCMTCTSLLKVDPDGQVVTITESIPLLAEVVSHSSNRSILRCPECGQGSEVPSIWTSGNLSRGVCRHCGKLLQADLPDLARLDEDTQQEEADKNLQ
jgi:transposase-like protein